MVTNTSESSIPSPQDFEQDVYPHLARIVNRVFADPDRASIALVLAWYAWERYRQSGKEPISPRLFANFACRQVKAGRDLPGIRSKFRDIWDRLPHWEGAGMAQVRDRRPGPVQELVAREQMESLLAGLNPKQRTMAALILNDATLGTAELAGLLGVSPGRVSQMRWEIMDRLDG